MAVLIRPYRQDDRDAVVEFYSSVSRLDARVPSVSTDGWSRYVSQESNEAGAGFAVAQENGSVIGLATSSLRKSTNKICRYFRIIVHPSTRRRHIGSRLLAHIVALDARDADVALQSLCPDEWEVGKAFLEKYQFQLLEHELEMSSVTRPYASAAPLPGLLVERSQDPGSLAYAISELHNRVYAHDSSFVKISPEGMGTLLAGAEVWAAHLGTTLVGYCHVEYASDYIWIDSLVVEPSLQRQGIGAFIAKTVLHSTLSDRCKEARLQVSDMNHAAYQLYRSLGFNVVKSSTRYEVPRNRVLRALHNAHAN